MNRIRAGYVCDRCVSYTAVCIQRVSFLLNKAEHLPRQEITCFTNSNKTYVEYKSSACSNVCDKHLM